MKKIMLVALALILGLASCVKDKQYPGITITDVTYSPAAVQDYDNVTVSATINCFKDFDANMVYTINNNSTTVAMSGTDNLYTAVIPAQPDSTTVSFYIEASNADAKATSKSMSYMVGGAIIDYSSLRLNELNGNDKFIEIFNNGTEAINMKNVTIYKDTDKVVWTGKNAVVVGPGEYLMLYSEDVVGNIQIDTNLYMFHSGLSPKKNVRIELKTPAGVDIDDFNLTDIAQNGAAYGYPNNQAPASYSRNADNDWYYADATPGAVNVDGTNKVLGLEGGVTPPAPTPDYSNIVLNELNGDTKFIEIYNKGDLDLTLEGMYILKDSGTDPTWTADATIIAPAHGYVLLYSEDVATAMQWPDNKVFHSGLSGKKTVRIALFMPDNTERDVYERGTTGTWGQTITNVGTQSFARTPDGGDWKLADPTPGAANPATGEDIPQE